MPVYFPASTSYSMLELMDAVNRKLENFAVAAVDEDEGDGDAVIFRLSHDNVVDGSLVCTVDDVATTDYTMDYDTGVFTFDAAPADDAILYWSYTYKHWPDEDVGMAIQEAVQSLFPAFYVRDIDTSETTTTGTYEYELATIIEAVTGVWWRSSSTSPWKRLKQRRWSIEQDGTTKYLVLHDNPTTGYLKLGVIRRAAPFAATSEMLTTIGLPVTAEEPIVLYACWTLLNQKFAKRVRGDQAIATQGEGAALPDQFQRAISAFKYAYDASIGKNRMAPWSVR